MNMVWLLYKKDIQGFFRRPLFYLMAGLCCLLWSPIYIYAFAMFLSQMITQMGAEVGEVATYHERVVVEFVTIVHFLILLFSSSVAMKLISEEKKNHTMTLLFVSPIKSWQIILSKYLTGFTVLFCLLGISFLYPLTTSFLGKVYWASLFTSYLGLSLFAAVYIAVGLFMSTLTSSLVMAFILALIANLSLLFLGLGSEITSYEWIGHMFEYMSFETIFKDFSLGIIRLQSIVFLLSIVAFCLVIAERALEASRWK